MACGESVGSFELRSRALLLRGSRFDFELAAFRGECITISFNSGLTVLSSVDNIRYYILKYQNKKVKSLLTSVVCNLKSVASCAELYRVCMYCITMSTVYVYL